MRHNDRSEQQPSAHLKPRITMLLFGDRTSSQVRPVKPSPVGAGKPWAPATKLLQDNRRGVNPSQVRPGPRTPDLTGRSRSTQGWGPRSSSTILPGTSACADPAIGDTCRVDRGQVFGDTRGRRRHPRDGDPEWPSRRHDTNCSELLPWASAARSTFESRSEVALPVRRSGRRATRLTSRPAEGARDGAVPTS
jgi:hypothetical protein